MSFILVVEDEIALQEIIIEVLGSLGHKILSANNGFDAAEIISNNRPIAMVTDLIMPKVNGWTLVNNLSIPTIVFTGAGLAEMKMVKANTKILEKPAGLFDLKEEMAKLLAA